MSDELTIKLKKESVWKYATFILAAVLVVWIIVSWKGGGSANSNTQQQAAAGNAGQQAAATNIDWSFLANNPDLYPSAGPANAKDTVVELADFQCPYCAIASGLPNWTSQYTSQYGDFVGSAKQAETLAEQGQIRFIFVPLSFLGQESVYAAEAGFCADDQNKFWEMHDAIYMASTGPQEDTGKYTKANLEIIAGGISGLDQTKFKNCLESDADLSKVNQVTSQVQGAGIQISTPQFFVNGKSVQASWAAIQAAF